MPAVGMLDAGATARMVDMSGSLVGMCPALQIRAQSPGNCPGLQAEPAARPQALQRARDPRGDGLARPVIHLLAYRLANIQGAYFRERVQLREVCDRLLVACREGVS